ncbi:arginine/serine-rich coiled-coil protein 2-like isoform X2 [Camellia sinensis]|uniref:arginine/serine-rich coiled-coil protein 2-like isoform X2 n=1 Tax=Camellia sinensis TaxID=4442 RepID=UPI001035A549|nr:arginine/serine-rich coiled-coil protein 2-like isoform X2 [Camellia sinensis]
MESNTLYPSPENADAKAAFRKPLNDAANRKYRRRSPVGGSSSSDGSPRREHSSSPIHSREDPASDSDPRRRKDDGRDFDRDSGGNHHGRSGDSYRYFDRQSSRSSHNYQRQDDYDRHEKHTAEVKNYSSSRSGRESRVSIQSDHTRRESEHYRSRDHLHGDDRYSRDRSDGSGRRSRDKEKETSSLEYQKYKGKDSLSDRAGSGRRYTNSNVEDIKYGERDRYKGDGDGRDEKRDYVRSSRDYRNDCSPVREEHRGHRNDSTSRRDSARHRLKEASKSDPRELDGERIAKKEKRKYDDQETGRHKDRYVGEPGEQLEDISKFTTGANERHSSSSKQAQELVVKVTSEQSPAKVLESANDIDAAKVAAMRAAELVNRNLIGTGYMSTDQKKKLLWGNKKSTTAEEFGHHWDTALFSDRERQEKFNKLMSLRLPWYLWPIVGSEGRTESGAQTRQPRKQWPPSREAEGTTTGFGEAIHCWTPSKRWPNCWIRSLRVYLGCFCSWTMTFSSVVLYFFARILSFVFIFNFWLVRANCALPFLFKILDHDTNRCCDTYLALFGTEITCSWPFEFLNLEIVSVVAQLIKH